MQRLRLLTTSTMPRGVASHVTASQGWLRWATNHTRMRYSAASTPNLPTARSSCISVSRTIADGCWRPEYASANRKEARVRCRFHASLARKTRSFSGGLCCHDSPEGLRSSSISHDSSANLRTSGALLRRVPSTTVTYTAERTPCSSRERCHV